MDGTDGGAFAAAAPPVGLGNFKGVMLCNRPADASTSKQSGSDEPAPFRSAVSTNHGEPLGLPPCKTFEPSVKKRGPSAALRRHVRWLKELQDQMKDERDEVDKDDAQAMERKQKMKAAYDQHRDAVREMMQERAKDWVDQSHDAEKHKRILEENARKKAEKQKSKPLWAMSAQEKESFEEGEADDLINFAEGLDFEKYMGDLDFREALGAMQDRAGKLSKVSDAFKDELIRDFNRGLDDADERSTSAGGSIDLEDGLEGASILGDLRSEGGGRRRRSAGEERYNADGRPEWDSSTQCGDEKTELLNERVRDAAEMVLESAPQMRAIHSKGSVQRIIEKARQQAVESPPVDLVEAMARDGPAQAPVIVASSDTQNRLHKPVDPSLLPYLYRSPAI